MITAESPHSCNTILHNGDNLYGLYSSLILLKCYTECGMYIPCKYMYDIKKWWAIITTCTTHHLRITNNWNDIGNAKPHSAFSPPKIISSAYRFYLTCDNLNINFWILFLLQQFYSIGVCNLKETSHVNIIFRSPIFCNTTPHISANKIAPLYHRVENKLLLYFFPNTFVHYYLCPSGDILTEPSTAVAFK
jgi:hypothetical protein